MRYKEISLCACCIEFRDEGNLNKTYFGVTGSSVVVLPLIGRWNKGRYKRGKRDGKEMAILIKSTFYISEFLGRSLVHPLFVLGYLHGSTKDGTSRRNLNKSAKVHCVERRV